ncbi:efflux RND transporter periplasmic adaptor subunit [Sagittula salina]|uniref:Efflux RND transporter periplasmic adaptor subunit n=1 Tax=Sagittula salina TaxID=2820268 RepID=A0A940MRC8_9RHOB|nr:efflux RND transporter periplasmic adaptor subunit [Sagittula salina]MBP0484425.1 efflux RND transporter periplasmic adaptor subunit [Sagittula salina]
MRGLILLALMPVAALAQQNYDTIGIDTGPGALLRGHSECIADLELAFPVSGIIAAMAVDEGATVTARDVLARLDLRIEEIELKRRQTLLDDQSELDSAQAQLAVSTAQYEAAQTLYDRGGAISKEDLQNRRLARDLTEVEVRRLRTQEALQALDRDTAAEALDRRTMHAPTQGIISRILRKPGESVQAYEPVLTLCDVSEILFAASLPAYGVEVFEGTPVTLAFVGRAPLPGRVRFVSPVVDAASGLREIKIDLLERPDWMRPGLAADLLLNP